MTSRPNRSHGRLSARASLQPRDLMQDNPELAGAWTARVITLLPDAFPGVLGASLTGKALRDGLWRLEPIDLRPFGEGRHLNVDDTPAGGGAGMVLRADVMERALVRAAEGTPPDRALADHLPVAARHPVFPADGAIPGANRRHHADLRPVRRRR